MSTTPAAGLSTSTHSSYFTAPRSTRYRSGSPTVSVSTLTTRSSSTTRLHQLDAVQDDLDDRRSDPHQRRLVTDSAAYRAWRKDSQDRVKARSVALDRAKEANQKVSEKSPPSRSRSKRKGKAVAFVVGAPSGSSGSGEDGEDEVDQSSPLQDRPNEPRRHEGRTSRSRYEHLIRSQTRQPVYSINPLDCDSLLSNGIADYTFALRSDPVGDTVEVAAGSAQFDRAGSPTTVKAEEALPSSLPSPPAPHPKRISLGKGKFSEVFLATKQNIKYAIKHTPLYSHHPLIASRLLREPTILAQLLPHPNLVKVYETVRTPGHFYLIEENLESSVTLEDFVASSPGGVVAPNLARSILEQLASVVQSLHEPLRVCHRDIKPENILVEVTPSATPGEEPTLLLKLLDFGLATHFSASQPKLTTCCGSPAYHSPELWRGLREPSGTVKYWGPEVDIWCLGLTVLRCLIPHKYPLGIAHSSLQALSDKVVDALLAVEDEELRRTLAGFLHMNSEERMNALRSYCDRDEVRARATATYDDAQDNVPPPTPGLCTPGNPSRKDFKSTTFIRTEPQYSLPLVLLPTETTVDHGSDHATGPRPLETCIDWDWSEAATSALRSRTPSRTRPQHSRQTSLGRAPNPDSLLSSNPRTIRTEIAPSHEVDSPQSDEDLTLSQPDRSPSLPPARPLVATESFSRLHYLQLEEVSEVDTSRQLVLLNPSHEPIRRAASYIKYALRCAGLLYHVAYQPECEEDEDVIIVLECVLPLPSASQSKASTALLAALALKNPATHHQAQRPSMLRAQTMGPSTVASRSSSTPRAGSGKPAKVEQVTATTVWLSIRRAQAVSSCHAHFNGRDQANGYSNGRSSRHQARGKGISSADRIIMSMSDDRAFGAITEALRQSTTAAAVSKSGATLDRGRRERVRPIEHSRHHLGNKSADSPATDAAGMPQAQGLAMSLGPPTEILREKSSKSPSSDLPAKTSEQHATGFFDFVQGMGERHR